MISSRLWAPALALVLGSGFVAGALANDDVLKLEKDPANVVMPSISYNGWNYSQLDKINLDNVKDLTVAWTFQLGVTDEVEASPLVVGDTMYVVTPKPNRLYALDLKNNGTIKWEFRPDPGDLNATLQVACCGAQTRGLNYAEGKIFFQTLGGHIYALNAADGKVVWDRQDADQIYGQTSTSNALIANNLYITGIAGGEFGVRGFVTAYDINTGKQRWRYYSTGPNNEMGIGPRFKPFYADDKVENPGLDTWYGDSWKQGGGTVWGFFTYDPDLNMFYYSTGNCGPWNPDYRREWGKVDLDENGGLASYQNKYCAGLMARDATTGELIWAYSISPQDQWDIDEPGINPLIDLEINGQQRKALVKAARNGYFYVFDRQTGELLNDPWTFVHTDYMTGVDKATGRPKYDIDKMMFTREEDRRKYTQAGAVSAEEKAAQEEEAKLYGEEANKSAASSGTVASWCPANQARNWENDAYSPKTGLLYTSASFNCRAMRVTEGKYVVPLTAEGYRLREWIGEHYFIGPDGKETEVKNQLQANDPVTGKTVWSMDFKGESQNPILATAGDLLFLGADDVGAFRAVNAKTGETVWEFKTGTGFANSPISYLGPDGQQYIAVVGSSVPGSQAVGADAAPDAENRYSREGSTLYVFALHRSVASAN